jgi:hypothetical protein
MRGAVLLGAWLIPYRPDTCKFVAAAATNRLGSIGAAKNTTLRAYRKRDPEFHHSGSG